MLTDQCISLGFPCPDAKSRYWAVTKHSKESKPGKIVRKSVEYEQLLKKILTNIQIQTIQMCVIVGICRYLNSSQIPSPLLMLSTLVDSQTAYKIMSQPSILTERQVKKKVLMILI